MNENLQKVAFWLTILVNAELAVGQGAVSLTHAIPDVWIPTVQAWCSILALLGGSIVTALVGKSVNSSLFSLSSAKSAASVVALAICLAAVMSPGQARAETFKPTGNIVNDVKRVVDPRQRTDSAENVLGGATSAGPFTCDISLFTKLNASTVVDAIKNCVGDAVAGISKPLADDLQDSLDSATKAGDKVAMGCYTPALALALAGQGVPAVKAADGTVTTPARPPGPVLVFQKFREFVDAGGILNCKTTVQSTINGTVAGTL